LNSAVVRDHVIEEGVQRREVIRRAIREQRVPRIGDDREPSLRCRRRRGAGVVLQEAAGR